MKPATELPWEIDGAEITDGIHEVARVPAHGPSNFRRQDLEYIVHAANLYPRLLDALRSTVRQLEAVPEDVPGWMQRTMLCRRARELAKEAGETWAMGNGETTDLGGMPKMVKQWPTSDLGGER